MNRCLHVMLITEGEARVDRCRRGAPILVQLVARGASLENLEHARGVAGVALTREAEVEWETVGRLDHHLDMIRRGRARCSSCACRRPDAATIQSSNAGRNGFLDDLRADPVHMGVDSACGDDELLARDRVGGHARDHTRGDAIHAVRIARLADAHDARAFDANVRLHHTEDWVDNESVGDDGVQSIVSIAARRLAHALAQHFPAAKLQLIAVHREVLLDLSQQAGVSQLDAIPNGRAEHGGVFWALENEGRALWRLRVGRCMTKAARFDALHHLG
mmetsp:Transcript_5452/g.16706  ORF Transcript_5452/g.16706 Transcript_5452/m.16706 type:complete len:276 (+) Transcript_5452:1246-2073(+)